jgi:hypothetical protein
MKLELPLILYPWALLDGLPLLGAEVKKAAQRHMEARLWETTPVRAIPPGTQTAPPLRLPTRPSAPSRARDFRLPVVPVHPVDYPEEEHDPLMV